METSARCEARRARGVRRALLLAGLALLPACLMIEFGVWDAFDNDYDEAPYVSSEVRACCLERAEQGDDYGECVLDAQNDTGPCAPSADAGTGRDADTVLIPLRAPVLPVGPTPGR